MPQSSRAPDSPARRDRRRRTHQRIDSYGDLAPRSRRRDELNEDPSSPSKHRPKKSQQPRRSSRAAEARYSSSNSTALSSDKLAQLDTLNQKLGWSEYDRAPGNRVEDEEDQTRAEYDDDRERDRREREQRREQERERRRQEHRERKRKRREEERRAEAAAAAAGGTIAEDVSDDDEARHNEKYKRYRRSESRKVSGQALERGSGYYLEKDRSRNDARRTDDKSSDPGYDEEARRRKRRRNIFLGVGVVALILIIAIPVGIATSKKSSTSGDLEDPSSSAAPSNSNLNGVKQSSIPKSAQGTYLDPFDWYDTTDFNVTYTDAKVGGLYIMGLNSSWDDSTRANDNVPKLSEKWNYGSTPFRGINLGGWLSIEPFITPSLFADYATSDGVVDEWTLCETLGASKARSTIEQHYSSWVQESTFAEIQAAGFDHVRIPFSYWAVTTYAGDPYVPMISWRYLLRGIEWARKYGLRINLDLHGAPGSQNGWNHSGHQGAIGWLNGTDGAVNGQRTIDIHNQLSTFFTQPRYQNIITMYGLVNEPKMTALEPETVFTWSRNAISTIKGNGYNGLIIMGDGFMGLDNWQGEMQGIPNLVLDAHQYVIFNTAQLVLAHHDKIKFACGGWTQQTKQSMNTATGFGPTMFGEWSQADTDCAEYLNNVGVGSRWEGTLNMIDTPGGATSGSVLSPTCPTHNNPRCSCSEANADPSSYSDEYKQWLLMFAEAQMYSFELGWGWFYWTWMTESAAQWSYKDAMAAGVMPKLAYERSWSCNDSIPVYGGEGLPEYY